MSVTVASCTLAEIFDAHINNTPIIASDNSEISGKLTIPEYQRPYRWQQKQVGQLLNDYEQYFGDVPKSSSNYGYYLGSLVLHQADNNKALNIIDGQQRITTLALIAYIKSVQDDDSTFDFNICYDSPESQKQIKQNLDWLEANHLGTIIDFDSSKINFTLVVTNSEDEAYRFFETHNTGGVRLEGPDIIKAGHLRSLGPDTNVRNEFAKKWEAHVKISSVVDSLIKGRFWQKINGQKVPPHRDSNAIREIIVRELYEETGEGGDDAFGRFKRTFTNGSYVDERAQQGYDLRQPLNRGANTINYLCYFEGLRVKYLDKCEEKAASTEVLKRYYNFYQNLICKLEGCYYLKKLYDTSLLLYISQFGEAHLDIAAIKLFRVIYSPRVSNQKAVKEASVPSFICKYPVLDWIALNYTPEMCFKKLDSFTLRVDYSNLEAKSKGIKKRFIKKVLCFLECWDESKSLSAAELAQQYETAMHTKIVLLTSKASNS